jgi:hypothetical protein
MSKNWCTIHQARTPARERATKTTRLRNKSLCRYLAVRLDEQPGEQSRSETSIPIDACQPISLREHQKPRFPLILRDGRVTEVLYGLGWPLATIFDHFSARKEEEEEEEISAPSKTILTQDTAGRNQAPPVDAINQLTWRAV